MLSPEVAATLREVLKRINAGTEEDARLLHRCWVEIRENEEGPEPLETLDLESILSKENP